MTHPGPDFLPYALPAVTQPTMQLPLPPAAPPQGGRWSRALDGVPALGVVSIGSGLGALVLLVLVSGLAGRAGPGFVVTALAAAVSLVTGWLAFRQNLPRDSKTLVMSGQSLGVLSALVAAMVYASSGTGGDQPVAPPSPQPSTSSSPSSGPQLLTSPPPSTVLPPGAVNGFGVPSDPGNPTSNDPTALGTLQGHVVDTAGRPIKGAVVTVTRATAGDVSSTPQCPTRVTTLTDADGLYQLRLCQLGDGLGYHVKIQVGRATVEHDLFVNSGNTTYYDVILPR
ncbi:MAG: Carboxypeptidase regulatory-like domain [Frankiales bacterium]|nr:Carboxypeptidase regulatory-like domain [Frankiales bacterium]